MFKSNPTPAKTAAPKDAARREILETLDVEETLYRDVARRFPIRWPQYYLDLAAGTELAKMGRPHPRELERDAGDIGDPVADRALRPHPFVVQKHTDRVILLTTKKCHFYCRFCFRREEPFAGAGEPGEADWHRIFQFLAEHPRIEEPILSGGDPLTLSDARLFWIIRGLEAVPSVKRIRIHSRAPVHQPGRITPQLVAGLAGAKPLRLVTHFNSARELTGESERIAALFAAQRIELLNQAVLLRGINDEVDAQRRLWHGLENLGITPHYLHHPDRVNGNAHFRVTLSQGRALYAALAEPGDLALPRYVLDLPDGRGKVPVMAMHPENGRHWRFRHPDGSDSLYEDFA